MVDPRVSPEYFKPHTYVLLRPLIELPILYTLKFNLIVVFVSDNNTLIRSINLLVLIPHLVL